MTTPRVSLVSPHLRPMAPVDVAWLRMDHPTNLMMVTALLSLDQRLSSSRLRSIIDERLLCFSRFRERVVERGRLRRRYFWQLDPHFDVESHMRSLALPSPGDEESLQRLVSQLMSTPLDRSKPLWQIHLIEDFAGSCALLFRIHHCIADGAALMQVLLGLTDETFRQARPPTAEEPPGLLRATAAELRRDLDLLVHPTRLVELARNGANGAATAGRLLMRPRDPKTALRGRLGVAKRAAWSEALELSAFKAIGRNSGSTVNDVLLTAVTGALRSYLTDRGDDLTGLDIRAAVPVDLRRSDERSRLGNRFGLVFVSLPVGVDDPMQRLFTIKRRMRSLKQSPEAAVVLELLTAVGRTGAKTQRRLVSLVGGKSSLVITNVPGPHEPLSLAGAPIRSMMFWVPMTGRVALGISILSYTGRVRVGIASDAGLVPDPETLARRFHAELDRLLELTRLPDCQDPSLRVTAH